MKFLLICAVLMLFGCYHGDESATCKWACYQKFSAFVGDFIVDGKCTGYNVNKNGDIVGLYCLCTKYAIRREIGFLLVDDKQIKKVEMENR